MRLPNNWRVSDIGSIISYKKGFAFKSSSFNFEEGRRVIRVSDTTANSIKIDTPIYLAEAEATQYQDYELHSGDIILTTVGSRPPLYDSMVGKAIKVPASVNGALLNQNMVKLTPLDAFINPDYLYSLLKTKRFLFHIEKSVRGNANQVSITLDDIFNFPVLLPPSYEQQKITRIFSTWDKTIEKLEALIAAKQKRKKALMQQLLTGKKRFAGFEGEWKKVRLGDILTLETGTSKSSFVDDIGGQLIIDMGSISREGKLIPSKRTSLTDDYLCIGHLVMPKDDIGGGNIIGRTAYIDQNKKYILSDHVFKITVNKDDSLFVNYLINSNKINQSLRRKANGTAQLGLSKKDVSKQIAYIPQIEEQKKIALVLSAADTEIETHKKQLTALKEQKKGLMQQLLTGKKRVKINKPERLIELAEA